MESSGRDLSPEQRRSLLNFLGYGNPAGQFWFIGIEERGVGTADTLWCELVVRANHFDQIDDLKRAQEHPAFQSGFTVAQQVTTWAVMSKIVLMMDGDPHWQDVECARRYQAERLGRAEGETFLADLLPLPADSVHDCPTLSCSWTRPPIDEKCFQRALRHWPT